MRVVRWLLFLAFTILTLVGCAASKPVVVPLAQQHRVDISKNNFATLQGSFQPMQAISGLTSFVVLIDGKYVLAGKDGWNNPIRIETGKRLLLLEFRRGGFTAQAQLELVAEAGQTYQITFESDAHIGGGILSKANSYCDFWITNIATGKAVSEIVRGDMSIRPIVEYVSEVVP